MTLVLPQTPRHAWLALVLVALSALLSANAYAAPRADELLHTCETALAAGYSGVDASMCDWYVAPCGVCGKAGPAPLAWCLPPGLTGAALAKVVVEELRKQPALATQPAPKAVAQVLTARYACSASP